MLSGSTLWDPYVSLRMEEKRYYGISYDSYVGLRKNLYLSLTDTVRRERDRICIVDDSGTKITYGAFLELVDSFADYLKYNIGIQKGDHVALLLFSSKEFAVAFLALIKLAAVTLPLPSKFREQEVLSLLEKSDAKVVLCEKQYVGWMQSDRLAGIRILACDSLTNDYGFAPLLDARRCHGSCADCETEPEDAAILMFTSGTTSLSKGVVLTNFNIMSSVETYRRLLHIVPEDRTVIAVPIYHVTGMIALLALFLYAGGTIYLHRFFSARRVLQCIRDERITFLHASPTVYSLLMAERADFPVLPSLRLMLCGSSYMPAEKILAMHAWLPEAEFRIVYGMTETASPATLFPCDTAQSPYITAAGLPVPGTYFRIVDDEGCELPDGIVGEVQICGNVILHEYYKLRTPLISDDGWLSTGDLGYFNQEGYLFLKGRKKDMINRGGEKICSQDVEAELFRLPGVEDAAVVGIPDALYGEVAAAAIQKSPGADLTKQSIQEALRGRLAKYKIPAEILFVEAIPVTPNGKVDKRALRSMFESRFTSG